MKNILIVDDDRSIRHILKEALSSEKFNTDIVQDAESAIKLIEKNLFTCVKLRDFDVSLDIPNRRQIFAKAIK